MRAIDALRMAGVGSVGTPITSTFITTDSIITFYVTAPNGTTLTVDWDDGLGTENFAMTGSAVTVAKNYGDSTTKNIVFSGSANALITILDCKDNTFLSSLDISKNTLLVDLNLTACREFTLDISTNILLTDLKYGFNASTSISISTNTLLTNIEVGNNGLNSTIINSHLADLVLAGLNNGVYISSNQTISAPPTGQGITDKATLITRGWSVTTD